MQQISWRAPDELVGRVRHAAAQSGWSVNAWMSRVLDAATDPDLSGSEVDRVRERLARAGLLAEPSRLRVTRPSPEELADARRAAGQGTPLSELVIEGRR
jgi:hypothetical protein